MRRRYDDDETVDRSAGRGILAGLGIVGCLMVGAMAAGVVAVVALVVGAIFIFGGG